jgi:hypothetical protein
MRKYGSNNDGECLLPCGSEHFCLSIFYHNCNIRIYKSIILSVVLYGCESWSLTLKEECRLWLSENAVLRRMFRHKQEEVTSVRRKLHIEELCNIIYILLQKLIG